MLRIRITLMRTWIRILLVTLMWIRILPLGMILLFTLMRIRILASKKRLRTLKKYSNRLIFHTFWLDICKLMRICIQLITMMLIRIRSLSIRCGSMWIRIRNTACKYKLWTDGGKLIGLEYHALSPGIIAHLRFHRGWLHYASMINLSLIGCF